MASYRSTIEARRPFTPTLHHRWPFLVLVAGSIASTWPLAARLGDRLPIGTERASTVTFFNLWTLEWGSQHLLPFGAYWDTPIFWPTHGAFALSDPQWLTGLGVGTLAPVVGSVAAYGLVQLGFVFLNGVSAYLLLRRFAVARGPAVLAGLMIQFLPFVANELGVLQLTPLFPVLFALVAMVDVHRSPRWSACLRLGLWTATASLTSAYYGAFLVLVLVFWAAVFLRRRHLDDGGAVRLLAGAAVAATLVLPVFVGQAAHADGYRWSNETVQANSARAVEWFQLDARALGAGFLPWSGSAPAGEQRLFPGTAVLLLALFGLVVAVRGPTRRWAWWFAGLAVGAAVLALGTAVDPVAPFSALRDWVPGFDRLRSPFRFAVVAQVALVLLAGFGLDALWRWRRALGHVVAIGIVGLGLLEVAALPARMTPVPDVADFDWVRWLDTHPGGGVALVPFPPTGDYVDDEPTTIGMLAGLEFHHPLLNGYSGFFPPGYDSLRRRMQDFPDQVSLRALRARAGALPRRGPRLVHPEPRTTTRRLVRRGDGLRESRRRRAPRVVVTGTGSLRIPSKPCDVRATRRNPPRPPGSRRRHPRSRANRSRPARTNDTTGGATPTHVLAGLAVVRSAVVALQLERGVRDPEPLDEHLLHLVAVLLGLVQRGLTSEHDMR